MQLIGIKNALRTSRISQAGAVAAILVAGYTIYEISKPTPPAPAPILSTGSEGSKAMGAAFEKIMNQQQQWQNLPVRIDGSVASNDAQAAPEQVIDRSIEQIPTITFEQPQKKTLKIERIE